MAQQPTSLLQYNFSPLHHHIAIQFSSHMYSLAIQFSSCNTNQVNYTLLLQYNSNTIFFSSPLSCNTIARLQYNFFFFTRQFGSSPIPFCIFFFNFFFHFFQLMEDTKNTYLIFFSSYWKNTKKYIHVYFFFSLEHQINLKKFIFFDFFQFFFQTTKHLRKMIFFTSSFFFHLFATGDTKILFHFFFSSTPK